MSDVVPRRSGGEQAGTRSRCAACHGVPVRGDENGRAGGPDVIAECLISDVPKGRSALGGAFGTRKGIEFEQSIPRRRRMWSAEACFRFFGGRRKRRQAAALQMAETRSRGAQLAGAKRSCGNSGDSARITARASRSSMCIKMPSRQCQPSGTARSGPPGRSRKCSAIQFSA